jgi:hypothetical protein
MAAIVDEMLARCDEVVGAVVAALRHEVPGYETLPDGDLWSGVATSVGSGLIALRGGQMPTTGMDLRVAEVAVERVHQGVALGALLDAYRLGARVVWRQVRRLAADRQVPEVTVLRAAELVWLWSDLVASQVATAHRTAELAVARRVQLRQSSFVPRLVLGQVEPGSVAAEALRHGVDPVATHRVFCASAPDRQRADTLDQVVMAACEPTAAIHVGYVGSSLAGLTTGTFDADAVAGGGVAVGLGPPTTVEGAARSFAVAAEVAEAAAAAGLVGVFGLGDLGALVGVAAMPHLGDHLVERYLTPLERLRHGGRPVIEAVEAMLHAGLQVEVAARRIPVHPNTVRYRVKRFEAVTGADLTAIDDLVGVWWAITWQGMCRRQGTACRGGIHQGRGGNHQGGRPNLGGEPRHGLRP